MEIRLNLGSPWYELAGWRVVSEGPSHRDYRPGPGKLAWRLMVLFVLLGLAAYPLYLRSTLLNAAPPFSDETGAALQSPLATALSEAEQEALRKQREQRQSHAIAAFRSRQETLAAVCAVASGMLAGIGLLAFLPLLVSKVSLRSDPRGGLIIRSGMFGRKKRVLSPQAFTCIQYGAEERAVRNRARRIVDSYWVWFVRLCPAMERGALSGAPVAFYPLRWKERPGAQPRPPEEVRALIQFLHSCTRLPVEGPQWAELGLLPNGRVGTTLVHTVATAPPTVYRTEHTIPLDQTPEALRSLASGGMSLRRISNGSGTVYVLEDSTGKTYQYNSPDEMSPAHRTFYDMMLQLEQ